MNIQDTNMLLRKFFDVWFVGRQSTAGRILMRNSFISQSIAKKTRHCYFDLTWRWNLSGFDQSSVPTNIFKANSSSQYYCPFFFLFLFQWKITSEIFLHLVVGRQEVFLRHTNLIPLQHAKCHIFLFNIPNIIE